MTEPDTENAVDDAATDAPEPEPSSSAPEPQDDAQVPEGDEAEATTDDGAATNVPETNGVRHIDPATGVL